MTANDTPTQAGHTADHPGDSTDSGSFWAGKKVLVTGHTGFKGAWLCLWLHQLGAEVSGLALDPTTSPSMYDLAGLDDTVDSHIGSISDTVFVSEVMQQVKPDVVFHLAAQVLVRESYDDPVYTFTTNVVGTANVLNAAREVENLKAAVVVTSDKCYENQEWHWSYRENEPMGGHDPYSASKGCAELVTASMRRSFFAEGSSAGIASARAGNVIGGGDWSTDRLIPDIVNAFTADEEVVIRMPEAVRPWQHVLEPVRGYIMLAERLASGENGMDEGWNFGPAESDAREVGWIVEQMAKGWGDGAGFRIERDGPHEAKLLKLDCSKAHGLLGWKPRLGLDTALEWVIDWYRAQVDGQDMRAFSMQQINTYRSLPDR